MPTLLTSVQPPPFRTPLLDQHGQLVETWRRFFLSSQAAIVQMLAAKPAALVGSMPIPLDDPSGFVDDFAALGTQPSALAGVFVPYVGAITNVNLGLFGLTATLLTASGLTLGSVIFAGAGGLLSQNNANFFWDNTNNRLGVGTNIPSRMLHVSGAGTLVRVQSSATLSNALIELYEPSLGVGQFFTLGFRSDSAAANAVVFGALGCLLDDKTLGGEKGSLVFSVSDGTGNNEKMRLTNQGRLGIGTVNPSQPLHVVGNAVVDSPTLFVDAVNHSVGIGMLTPGTNKLSILSTIADYAMYINNNSAAGSSYGFLVDAGFNTADQTFLLRNRNGSVNYMFVRGDGRTTFPSGANFGIGTTAPLTLFSVAEKFQVDLNGLIPKYNNIATVGNGVPAIYGQGRLTAQSGAVASVATYTVGAADGSFLVSMSMLITAFTAGTVSGVVTYTSEDGTARSLTLNFSAITGVLATTAGAAGAFEGVPLHIRAKAATAITCTTTVSIFTGTYNVEGIIQQLA